MGPTSYNSSLGVSNHKQYSASAPGSLFLLGEHAVLQNKQALVLAVNKRIRIELAPRTDQLIYITSPLGNFKSSLNTLKIEKPFQFVLATIQHVQHQLKKGFDLSIISEFSSEIGLGSSAAVTVATLAVLNQFIDSTKHRPSYQKKTDLNLFKLFEDARSVIQKVQGIGSGADAAASVYGGLIMYQQLAPYILKKFLFLLPLSVVYSGYKTPTPEVVKKVKQYCDQYPKIVEALFAAMDHVVTQASIFVEQENWPELGRMMDIQQGIMCALGVSTPLLNKLVDTLRTTPQMYGAKISGSGLGDCVIGIGLSSPSYFPQELEAARIPVEGTLQGVCYE
jgi:mevalonate kinase